MSDGNIYAPDYLRKQDDKQLHLIADLVERNADTISSLLKRCNQIEAQLADVTRERDVAYAGIRRLNSQQEELERDMYFAKDERDQLRARCEEYKAALEFYASCPPGSGMMEDMINGGEFVPLGERARAALTQSASDVIWGGNDYYGIQNLIE